MSSTTPNREQRIRERAYFLWEAAGRPEGAAENHWHEAEAVEANSGEDLQADEAHEGSVASNEWFASRESSRTGRRAEGPEASRQRR